MPVTVPGVTLGEFLGGGAFGEVYRGRHEGLRVDVAVKLIDIRRLPAGEQLRVLQEAQLMARLDHPNLLRVFDAGSVEEQAYIVLELMDGGSCAGLHDVDPATAQGIAQQLVSGVQALHDARVLHRDIKPANCLRRARDQRVKLADLGLAVEVATQGPGTPEMAGTIPFMAPELFETPPRFGPASDLYALGMTLACFVLPEPPYPRGPIGAVFPWIHQGQRPNIATLRPDLAAPLAQLIQRMISPRLEERPASAGAALVAMGLGVPPPAPPAGAPASLSGTAVGPWLLGETVHDDLNWRGFAVTHVRSGTAGRLMRLRSGGPLGREGAAILQSAERASRLAHPRIVPVMDWGAWDERAYVVTPARGSTIDQVVRARGAFDELTALRFAAHLAEGLAFLHARGLVYQSLDPGAAVIGADARSALLSWAVHCVPAGTPAARRIMVPRYAAPEAITGSSTTIDPPVDVFGLGTIAFFMVAGEVVPRFASVDEIRSRLRAAAPQVTAPSALLVSDLLNPDQRARPSAEEARGRIEEILAHLAAEGADQATTWLR